MIRTKIEIKSTETTAYKKMKRELPKLRNAYVSIGFHEDAGQYEDGTSVIDVALWNEFGTKTTPQRSFIRSSIDENESKINQWREELLKKVVEGEMTVTKALSALGTRIVILIQNKIKSNVGPELAPSTRERKLREGVPAVTLIDTKLMLRSVTFKVVVEK